jgi:hypothetical protein
MAGLTDDHRARIATWAALDACQIIEGADDGELFIAAWRKAEPLASLIELMRRERPLEADGSLPAHDRDLVLKLAREWRVQYAADGEEYAQEVAMVDVIIRTLETEGRGGGTR